LKKPVMSRLKHSSPATWWQCEPRRLARDTADVAESFPDLQWHDADAGHWVGWLPRWPFSRPEPAALAGLVGEEGLRVDVEYGHAYPMVAPSIHPLDVKLGFLERTNQRWHVMGDGSLCLLQSHAEWDPRGSIVDLLLKAAGWRVEYALMKAGLIEAMTINGIVTDDRNDHLVTKALTIPADTDDGAVAR
jgi:hypothetical protein